MKKLVTEIDKNNLIKILPLFGVESQITIGEDAPNRADGAPTDSGKTPFYIEENIADLDKILSLCDDIDNAKSPLRKAVDWNVFCDFWELMLNIQKQREFGVPLTNIEYIYRKGLQLHLPITLQRASVELGFTPELNYYVITGESELGKMMLYQDYEDILEYVFSVEYFRVKKFSKKRVKAFTHWHPRGCRMALDDMTAFMKNDKEYLKRNGLTCFRSF